MTENSSNKFRQTVLETLLEKERVEDVPGSFALKTGEKVPVSFSGSVIKNADGQTTDLVVVAKDLRELKEYARKRLAVISPVLQKILGHEEYVLTKLYESAYIKKSLRKH